MTVRGSRGTAHGWVSVHIAYSPKDVEHRREIEALIWKMFARDKIEIGTYGYDDPGSDYGYGRKIHLGFDPCLDTFAEGEAVLACNGKTGTILRRDYTQGGDWYVIQLADGGTDQYYKNDLTRAAA